MDSSSESRITAIAVVQQLFRFPVKSMRGEELREGRISWHGLDGDRRYAFVKTGNLAPFPWLTARDVPDMLRLAAAFGSTRPLSSGCWTTLCSRWNPPRW
ncbi:MAG TPA: MOSC N-terminal beta barrel domain-containing protein [Herpetosiphonaceae bacterium]|nr:MOSC N-terminal beta barrel domain-containing protein [Herpetosiphonaceae bacterium]